MLRRVQLALLLVLLLVLAPLASATCGISCLSAAFHPATQAETMRSTMQYGCVRASACCHSRGPAVCDATQTPETIAALFATDDVAPQHDALATRAAGPLPPSSRSFAADRIDCWPPGQAVSLTAAPLRL